MMKKVIVMVWVLVISTMTFAQTKNIQVQSDKALNQDFSEFKTFSFASMIDSDLEAGLYFLNDLIFKSQIRDAVKDEMMGLGYELDRNNPDLIVNFRVFDKPVTLRGYDGYGSSYWGIENYRQISDKASYDVKAGTLLVSFLDRKNSKVVWQGFASGLINGNDYIKDKGTIREAVNLIMDEYGIRANSYSRK